VLYTCCSETVARAVVRHVFNITSVELDELQPDVRPTLAELDWSGEVVDMASVAGLVECGFRISYPEGYTHAHTQPFATGWHVLGAEGVLCRSDAVFRTNHRGWVGEHEEWSELAIFIWNATVAPRLLTSRPDFDWQLE
jgi:hypothetical protein